MMGDVAARFALVRHRQLYGVTVWHYCMTLLYDLLCAFKFQADGPFKIIQSVFSVHLLPNISELLSRTHK